VKILYNPRKKANANKQTKKKQNKNKTIKTQRTQIKIK
jgi:hypothetical protein